MINLASLTAVQLHEIAKIVSNEYIGKSLAVEVTHSWKQAHTEIKTNTCDLCPAIRVGWDGNVQVNGDYTEGWQKVQPETQRKISIYLSNL